MQRYTTAPEEPTVRQETALLYCRLSPYAK